MGSLMKLETIADIIKIVMPFLRAKIIFYTILVLALAFWVETTPR